MAIPLVSTASIEQAGEAMLHSKLAIMKNGAEDARGMLDQWLASRVEGLPPEAYKQVRGARAALTYALRNANE